MAVTLTYVNGGQQILTGSGAPAVAAPVGSLYLRSDAVANQLYVKETGTGTTGWSPVATSSGVFNVKDYGAIGDGSTPDYAAVASAISAASSAGGGSVYFPPGTYPIATSLAIPSNVRLIGCDKNSSILSKTASIDLLDFSGASNASRCQRGGAMDIKLNGAGFAGRLIKCKWADHLNFDRVWCYNNADTALYTENLWDTYFNNVEFDTCSGSAGLGPAVQITSNADDSSNIIVFNGCRWENFIDGALWISSRAVVAANTPVTGTNPPYGIFLQNCKMETPQLKGAVIDMSADVQTLHVDGLYLAARGVFSGGPYGLINANGANDLLFERIRAVFVGASTVYSLFYIFTNATITARDIHVDAQNNPTVALVAIAGGSPDLLIENMRPGFGQTPTMFSGTWPPQIASATALTLLRNPPVQVVTGTTTITSITAQLPGRVVTLQFSGILTLTDGSNLKLAGNFVTTADDSITLVCDGTNWIEMARSVN